MDNENNTNEIATDDISGGATYKPPDNQCPTCMKTFDGAQALRMHVVRVHTEAGRNAATKGRQKNASEAERLVKRRQYQKQLRDRYYREGKNSKGEKMPKGWQPRQRRNQTTYKTTDAERDYARKWFHKKQAAKKKAAAAAPAPQGVTFCPRCGCNIRAVAAAIQFGDNQ
jgi:hypothetical protein